MWRVGRGEWGVECGVWGVECGEGVWSVGRGVCEAWSVVCTACVRMACRVYGVSCIRRVVCSECRSWLYYIYTIQYYTILYI